MPANSWFLFASILIVAELFTGSFYLLVIGLAAAAAGVCAEYTQPVWIQYAVAAGIANFGVLGLRTRRTRSARLPNDQLDINKTVEVLHWQEDGSARVHYRGSEWNARLLPGSNSGQPRYCSIHAIEGNTLILTPRD